MPGPGPVLPSAPVHALPLRSQGDAARWRQVIAALNLTAIDALLMLPGAMVLALSFHGGGFAPGTTALAAFQAAVVTALVIAFSRLPLAGVRGRVLLVGALLAGLALWTLMSAGWSHSGPRALFAYNRVLLYGMAFLVFATFARTDARMTRLVYGLAAAITAVCVVFVHDPASPSYPVGYWNNLGILAGVGLILCGHLACGARGPRIARVLGAAAVPLLCAALSYSHSLDAAWATAIGACVYVVASRPRGILAGSLATAPATVVALASIDRGHELFAARAGFDAFRTLLLCAALAAACRLCVLPLDTWVRSIEVPRKAARGAAVVVAAASAAAIAILLISGGGQSIVREELDRFARSPAVGVTDSHVPSRAAVHSTRMAPWHVALGRFRAHPSRGDGAGTFEIAWNWQRRVDDKVVNAHSLYLETLGELGWPGLALLAGALIGILTAFALRLRGRERGLYAALLGAGVAWAVHAGVDWSWQMPATTLWLFASGGLALAAPATARRGLRSRRARRRLRVPVAVGCALLALAPARAIQAEAQLDRSERAALAGSCNTAVPAANAALRKLDGLGDAYRVIASCEIHRHRQGAAITALHDGVAKDPDNWQLWYELALAKARAGLDPRTEARQAQKLNAREPLARAAVTKLAGESPARWRRNARRLPTID
jgi:hypothetical protein